MSQQAEARRGLDRSISAQRQAFKTHVHPYIGEILREDSAFGQIVQSLNQRQQDALCGVVEDFAAILRFGRMLGEYERRVKLPAGTKVVEDPLENKLIGRLREAEVRDINFSMIRTASDTVLEAIRNDPRI